MSVVLEKVLAEPCIKYVGGKRQLLPEILPRLPATIGTYFEPFVGGGAVFFALANESRFQKAVLGDTNEALINLYAQLRDNPSRVLDHLRMHAQRNCEDYFYEQRARSLNVGAAGAARLVYLLRTCFNGLFRVNKDGGFNTPWGAYENPRIVDVARLRAVASALQGVVLVHGDFERIVRRAAVGDAVYFDPPYLPVSPTANFTAYGADGFDEAAHERLAECVAACVKRGANCLLSNSDCKDARRIFTRGQWHVETVSARRNINSDGGKRGAVGEILVTAPRRCIGKVVT